MKKRVFGQHTHVFRAHGAHFSETAPLHHFYIKVLILLLISVVQLLVQLWCSCGAVVVQSKGVLADCTMAQM